MEVREIPVFIYEILLCFLVSWKFYKNGNIESRLMPFFFFISLCVEYYCALLMKKDQPTDHIYNFWFPVEYIFYGFVIERYITSPAQKKISQLLIVLYLVFTIIYYLFRVNMNVFSSLTYLTGFLMLLIIMLFKLYEILNQEIIRHPLKNDIFWFIMGILIVNLGGFFHFGAENYIYQNNQALYTALQWLNIYLTEFQYVCFLIYFICKWNQNSHT